VCRDEESCERGRLALIRAGKIVDDDNQPVDDDLFGEEPNVCFLPPGSSSERFVRNLLKLKTAKPMLYASLHQWSENLHAVSKKTYAYFVEGIKQILSSLGESLAPDLLNRIRDAAPPLNIRRVLESNRVGIHHTEVLSVQLKKRAGDRALEAFVVFHFRDPIDAAFDLHRSPLLHTAGPYYGWKDLRSQCSAKTMPRLFHRLEQFCAHNHLDPEDPATIIIPVLFYFDDT
jgi:hypothetical protein